MSLLSSALSYGASGRLNDGLRTGLAEGLRSELQVYGIGAHVASPATILSPGLDEENEVKPKITLKIEETDSGSPPADIAAGILRGEFEAGPPCLVLVADFL